MCEGGRQTSLPLYPQASASPAATSPTPDRFSQEQLRPWEPGLFSWKLLSVKAPPSHRTEDTAHPPPYTGPSHMTDQSGLTLPSSPAKGGCGPKGQESTQYLPL